MHWNWHERLWFMVSLWIELKCLGGFPSGMRICYWNLWLECIKLCVRSWYPYQGSGIGIVGRYANEGGNITYVFMFYFIFTSNMVVDFFVCAISWSCSCKVNNLWGLHCVLFFKLYWLIPFTTRALSKRISLLSLMLLCGCIIFPYESITWLMWYQLSILNSMEWMMLHVCLGCVVSALCLLFSSSTIIVIEYVFIWMS